MAGDSTIGSSKQRQLEEAQRKLEQAKLGSNMDAVAKAQKQVNQSQAASKAQSESVSKSKPSESSKNMTGSKDPKDSGGSGGDAAKAGLSMGIDVIKNSGIIGDGSTTDTGSGAAEGAIGSALSAAPSGNPYAIVGSAILGGVTGGLKAKAARKQALAKIEAEKHQRLGQIEAEKESKKQAALSELKGSFSRTLNTNKSVNLGGR